jgi:hypothetical protein
MMNCTAAEHLDLMDAVYGDYMDGNESIVFSEGTGFEHSEPYKMKN